MTRNFPVDASWRAEARPIPLLLPVMITVLISPLASVLLVLLSWFDGRVIRGCCSSAWASLDVSKKATLPRMMPVLIRKSLLSLMDDLESSVAWRAREGRLRLRGQGDSRRL